MGEMNKSGDADRAQVCAELLTDKDDIDKRMKKHSPMENHYVRGRNETRLMIALTDLRNHNALEYEDARGLIDRACAVSCSSAKLREILCKNLCRELVEKRSWTIEALQQKYPGIADDISRARSLTTESMKTVVDECQICMMNSFNSDKPCPVCERCVCDECFENGQGVCPFESEHDAYKGLFLCNTAHKPVVYAVQDEEYCQECLDAGKGRPKRRRLLTSPSSIMDRLARS